MSPPIIFVIDDDASVRKALQRLIRSAGMEVRTFESAADFLQAKTLLPDCMVVDIRMPGMSGLELQQHLLAADQHVPIVFISAHDVEQVHGSAIAAGAIDVLHKPFEDHVLLERLERSVAKGSVQLSSQQRIVGGSTTT